jgi:Carboxypeptidase regulatory-like domain
MSRRSVLAIFLALFPVFVPATATSQSNGAAKGLSISGYVRTEDTHEAVPSVALELRTESGESASSGVVTGTNGEFQFNGVVSGNYLLSAREKGYEPVSMEIFLGGFPLTNVLVNLRKISQPDVFEAGSVSAHQLSVPDKARDAYERGIKLLTRSKPDYARAIEEFQRAVRECADYYEAYAEMGIAQYRMGDNGAAERNLRKSAELSANHFPDAFFLLAEMLNDENRFGEAVTIASQGITADPSSFRGHLQMARALAGLRYPVKAEISALRAEELDPNQSEVYLTLGNIHIQQHNYAAVVQDFDNYLKLDPSGPRSDLVRNSQTQARRALEKSQAEIGGQAAKP